MENTAKTVAVLGASTKPERYANRAVAFLLEKGFKVVPVNPAKPVVHGLQCVASLQDIASPVHTLTVYVSPGISSGLESEILRLSPERAIFNPGSENPLLETVLRKNGIEVVEACTLVMLTTGLF